MTIQHPKPKPPDTHDEAIVHGSATQPEDYPRLVYLAPYFDQAPLAELFEPAVIEAAKTILPPLVQPAADQAAAEAVAELAVMRVGDTMSGPLFLAPLVPTVDSQAATKHYVDSMGAADLAHAALDDFASDAAGTGGAVGEAPTDGVLYGRKDKVWAPVSGAYMPIAGGTLTGGLTIADGDLVVLAGNIETNYNLTATGAVLGGRVVADATGLGFGGPVLSWDSSNAAYAAGFRYNVNGGALEFGPANAASGLTSVAAKLTNAGALTVNALTVNGSFATTGNIGTSTGNLTSAHAVIGDHLLAFRTGTGTGGAVGSYDTTTGLGGGMRFNVAGHQLEFGPLNPATGNLTSSVMVLTSAGTVLVNEVDTAGISCSGGISAGGNITATGDVLAGASGVHYPAIAALGSGQAHGFGFDWNGSEVSVWVDGAYRGRMAINLPRAEELEARIAALEARLRTLEAAAP